MLHSFNWLCSSVHVYFWILLLGYLNNNYLLMLSTKLYVFLTIMLYTKSYEMRGERGVGGERVT